MSPLIGFYYPVLFVFFLFAFISDFSFSVSPFWLSYISFANSLGVRAEYSNGNSSTAVGCFRNGKCIYIRDSQTPTADYQTRRKEPYSSVFESRLSTTFCIKKRTTTTRSSRRQFTRKKAGNIYINRIDSRYIYYIYKYILAYLL